jgi:cob(I)alamin adenosyltransferase
MKIYTKTGDGGETGLFGGGRVGKDAARVDAYGEVDELNAVLGLAESLCDDAEIVGLLRDLQRDLFTLGAILASPAEGEGGRASAHVPELRPDRIAEMERRIDRAEEELPPLRNFILPGGHQAGAALHLARTVCRRAERRVVALAREIELPGTVVPYLNRLSDLLFTLARLANRRAGAQERPWVPRGPVERSGGSA